MVEFWVFQDNSVTIDKFNNASFFRPAFSEKCLAANLADIRVTDDGGITGGYYKYFLYGFSK